jgi:hypothetical protein
LDPHCAGHRVERRFEGDEEAISLVLDDPASIMGAGLLHDAVVVFQDRSEGIAELLKHPRRET